VGLNLQTEIKEEKIPWIPIVILTIIFSFFGPLYTGLTPNASWYGLGSIGCKLLLLVTPLFLIMGAAILGRLLHKSINLTTYTFIYAIGTCLYIAASNQGFPLGTNIPAYFYDRVSLAPEVDPWPLLMAPPADVIEPMVNGGALVPWAAWVPTFSWWGLEAVSFALFALGWGVIWRRRWIDVEKVPFPQTRISMELVNRITSTEKSLRARLGLPTLVGIILGIIFQLPLLLMYMFPWFPDIYGWRTNTCTMGAQYLTPDSPLAAIVGLAQFNKDPAVGAIFYMAPLNVLFGAWFWYLVFAILMQIAYSMGYYTGILDLSGCGRVWCGRISYRVGDPFKWDVFSSAGVTTGIFISYIALNWKYLAETFNAAIGKLSEDKLREFSKTEPTSYRNAYIMMGVSTILIVALFMAVDVSIPAALLFLLSNIVVGFVATRAYSLVGFVVPAGSTFYLGPMKMLLGGGTGGGTREWFVMMSLGTTIVVEPITSGGGSSPFASSLATYQMASANKVSSKSVFKIMLFVSILAPLIALAGDIWGMYTFGVTHLVQVSGSWSSAYSGVTPDAMRNRPAYEPWWPQMIAGAVFAMLLSFMHARFVWFPLEPIGFLLATDGHALIEGIWTMALAAWIAKTITLRVGGSKLYERSGIPVAIGFIIGLVIITIIGGALLDFRFFYPF
jgi:hypothetical protein